MIFVHIYKNMLFYRYDSCHNRFMAKKQITFMKKLLSILCVSIIALTAASCKKETVVAPGAIKPFSHKSQ
jgi:hypothetical protein